MKSKTLVSVVTTVYNGEEYVDRSVDSIMSQDYPDFEWVIVDDGSTDNTVSKLNERVGADHQVRVYQPGRLGRSNALNFAVDKARGEYIANHDFDDISLPNRLSLQAEVLELHNDVGVIGGNHIAVDDIRGERYVRRQPVSHDEVVRAMAKYIPFAHTIAMFRKRTWEDAGGYPEAENAIDMRLWCDVLKTRWKFRGVPEVLGKHFIYKNSFWNENFGYLYKQYDLAKLNARAITLGGLPRWMYIYPASRIIYTGLPTKLKRLVRRNISKLNEKDI